LAEAAYGRGDRMRVLNYEGKATAGTRLPQQNLFKLFAKI
jgi:hypothetical protein